LSEQITMLDESLAKVGVTFPRRAKQLVNKQRAYWLDETHTTIVLLSADALDAKTDETVIDYTKDTKPAAGEDDTPAAKEEAISTLRERYEAFLAEGKSEDEAIDILLNDARNTEGLPGGERKKSLVMDAYRDSEKTVLRSSAVELIRKSRRRTRELHTAFSSVLWLGTALLYFGTSFLFGYTAINLNPSEMSWTWLIFIIAALAECCTEVFFCRKELAVLKENIDLRQMNPVHKRDMDLHAYKRKLMHKIQIMYSAATWLPILLAYFACGYVFHAWGTAWIIFALGAFCELFRNFMTKLKKKAE